MNKIKQRMVVVLKAVCLVIVLGLLCPLVHLCHCIWTGCEAFYRDLIDVYHSPLATKQEIKRHIEHLKNEWREEDDGSSS